MEKIILNIWYSNQIFYRLVSYILIPISLVYILIFYLIRIFKIEHRTDIPIICIYHGSSLDLLKMPFNKIWLFDHKNNHTEVSENNFINYKKKLIDEINEDIY